MAAPIGVYDHPPPAGIGEGVQAVRMADADSTFAGAGLLLKDATRVRDAINRFKDRLLG